MELITIENLENIKSRLYDIEKKVSTGIATEIETKWAYDIILNSIDYSELYRSNKPITIEDTITKRIQHADVLIKESRHYTAVFGLANKFLLKRGKNKPFKKELDLFFKRTENIIKLYKSHSKSETTQTVKEG